MIKILVTYHKNAPIVKNDIFMPIHIGAALKQNDEEWCKDMLSDMSGDNISLLNSTYNELTAIYWAWKNYDKLGNPEYIGITHYRRFFIFKESTYAYYEQKEIKENFFDKINAKNLSDTLFSDYDFIAPMPNVRKSVFDNYCSAHHKDDIELALNLISSLCPDMREAAHIYVSGKAAFFYNMFVFSKNDFFKYCEFIFKILEEFSKQTLHPNERFFISEVLTGIFFIHLLTQNKKPIFYPVLFIGSKPSLKQSFKMVQKNFSENSSGFFFKIKPLIVYFIPNFILLQRKRKTISLTKIK